MKTILFSLTILFFTVVAYAQQKPIDKFNHDLYRGKLTNKDFFTKADFIFEAEMVNPVGITYLSKDSTKVYGAGLFKITEIYKGADKLQTGTVTLVVEGGSYIDIANSFNLDYKVEHSYDFGIKNIFFCKVSDLPLPERKFSVENKIILTTLENSRYSNLRFESSMDYNFTIYGLNNLYFRDKADFYKYASQYRGVEIPGSIKKKAEQKPWLKY